MDIGFEEIARFESGKSFGSAPGGWFCVFFSTVFFLKIVLTFARLETGC